MIKLLVAIQFLTLLPVGKHYQTTEKEFRQSVVFFAPVGFLIGCITWLLFAMLRTVLPLPLLAVAVTLALATISGFLHLDGLADTMDGFFSSRPKERKLEIMKDSRIGAMGVIALFFVLALKIVSFANLPNLALSYAIILVPLSGRCALVFSMAVLPYARPEGGLGALFYGSKMLGPALISLFLTAAVCCLFKWWLAPLVIAVIAVVTGLFGWWCKRSIGGNTGDTLGALCEITETSVVLVLVCVNYV